MPTPHNNANKGDFAKTVLMPGDPLRAKFIAETFLTELMPPRMMPRLKPSRSLSPRYCTAKAISALSASVRQRARGALSCVPV